MSTNNRQLFLGNVSYKATVNDIRDTFSALGIGIGAVRIGTEQDTGRSRGFAFVDLTEWETRPIGDLIELASGALICDRAIRVDVANQRTNSAPRAGSGRSESPPRRKRGGGHGGGGRRSGGGSDDVWDD